MGLYANPQAAETRLRLALKYQLQQVTIAGGYRNDLVEVWDKIPSRNELASFPCAVLVFGKEEVLNTDQSEQLWHIEVPIVIMAFVNDNDDAALARESIKLDIKQRLGNYWQIPGPDGVETAFQTRYTGAEPFGMVANEPRVGVAIGFRIRFREDILDPSVAA